MPVILVRHELTRELQWQVHGEHVHDLLHALGVQKPGLADGARVANEVARHGLHAQLPQGRDVGIAVPLRGWIAGGEGLRPLVADGVPERRALGDELRGLAML